MTTGDQQISHFYTQAEVSGEDQTWLDGTKDRLVKVRFRTLNVDDAGESEGHTEWVTFTLTGLDHLSTQLAAAVETIRRWTPGEQPEPLGINLGVTARNVRS
jgi:hypothetical protein